MSTIESSYEAGDSHHIFFKHNGKMQCYIGWVFVCFLQTNSDNEGVDKGAHTICIGKMSYQCT